MSEKSGVAVGEGVLVGTRVGIRVGRGVTVSVSKGVGVSVGAGVASAQAARRISAVNAAKRKIFLMAIFLYARKTASGLYT
jgi:hypothetical protein